MCKAAIDLGFQEDQARCIVKHTLNGSVLLWDDASLPAETLRRDVMSPGGTAEESRIYKLFRYSKSWVSYPGGNKKIL